MRRVSGFSGARVPSAMSAVGQAVRKGRRQPTIGGSLGVSGPAGGVTHRVLSVEQQRDRCPQPFATLGHPIFLRVPTCPRGRKGGMGG